LRRLPLIFGCWMPAYPVGCQTGTKRRDPESAKERRAGTDASQPVWSPRHLSGNGFLRASLRALRLCVYFLPHVFILATNRASRVGCFGSIKPPSRQKPQQSRQIVPYQGSRENFKMPPHQRLRNLAFSLRRLAFCFKTPVIVHDQASSRQIKASAKKSNRHHAIGPPTQNRAPLFGRAGAAAPPHIK